MTEVRKFEFRFSYLTCLGGVTDKTELSDENDDEAESAEIIFPPSHSLTDREYFNIGRTEDGQSRFHREQDEGRH